MTIRSSTIVIVSSIVAFFVGMQFAHEGIESSHHCNPANDSSHEIADWLFSTNPANTNHALDWPGADLNAQDMPQADSLARYALRWDETQEAYVVVKTPRGSANDPRDTLLELYDRVFLFGR